MRILISIVLLVFSALAQERVDLSVVNRIKNEAFQHSKVMEHLSYLTDMYGPRLTGSPEYRQAADWAVKRLQEYGLTDAKLEKWGPFGRSWSLEQFSVEMLEPRYAELTAAPLAWTAGTNGPVTAEAILAPLGRGRRFDLKVAQANLEKFMADYKGKLGGKVVLISSTLDISPETRPPFHRYTDGELTEMALAPMPIPRIEIDLNNLRIPDNPQQLMQLFASLPPSFIEAYIQQMQQVTNKRNQFLKDEGAVAVLQADERAHTGLIFAEQSGAYEAKNPLALPTFVVTGEQYNRMVRLAEKKAPVKVRINLKAQASEQDVDAYNIIGDIPGTTKPDEMVMVGAHFDSWHTGTGATDNGAGSAVMMEVVRILKALNLRMDRTVRIGLWAGEEEGLLGSRAYVKEHLGDPATMKLTAEHAKFSGYFNLDNGSGKIRGVYLQGNDAMRPLFEEWLEPFADLGAKTVTIRNTGGTDHQSFDAVGLPGFQFIQDPLDYGTVTHHSDMDVYDQAQPGDLMQASAIIASITYNAATRPEMLPRKPLPKPEKPAKKTD